MLLPPPEKQQRPFGLPWPPGRRLRPPTPDLWRPFPKRWQTWYREMLAEYGAMDAMEPLPQEIVRRELDMEEAA